MLDRFEAWYSDKAPTLEQQGYGAEFTRPRQEADKNGAYADIFSDLYAGRITVWDTGECDLDVLDYKTGSNVFWKNHVFQDSEEMISTLDKFCNTFFNAGAPDKSVLDIPRGDAQN